MSSSPEGKVTDSNSELSQQKDLLCSVENLQFCDPNEERLLGAALDVFHKFVQVRYQHNDACCMTSLDPAEFAAHFGVIYKKVCSFYDERKASRAVDD